MKDHARNVTKRHGKLSANYREAAVKPRFQLGLVCGGWAKSQAMLLKPLLVSVEWLIEQTTPLDRSFCISELVASTRNTVA